MTLPLPIVRHFLACEEVVSDGTNVTLRNLIQAVLPLPGEKYPLMRDRMALYAVLSSCRGKRLFALEMTRFEGAQEASFKPPSAREIDLGQDPIAFRGLPIPLKVAFVQPGHYTFHLLCDGIPIAAETILLKEEQ
jgi:hypothetical protein